MGDDRKKSWREIDAGRDKGGGRQRRDPDAQHKEKVEKSAAYSKYKAQLDKLFTPGGAQLPEAMREKLGPVSPEAKARKEALDALKASPDAATLKACLDQGVALPEDPRLLTALLDVKDEALLPPVLAALSRLVDEGKKPNRMLLIQKLDALANRASDGEVLAAVRALREAVT